MSLTNKIDFAVVFKVKNANPNGDPLNGNRPRTNYDRIGEVSDVCIKRKIRNRLMETKENNKYKYQIFVQSDDNRLDDCKNLRERAETVWIPKNPLKKMLNWPAKNGLMSEHSARFLRMEEIKKVPVFQ